MNKKRVFIACADERLRIALLLHLESEPGLSVVGITDSLESLLPQMEASRADILLLEWQLTVDALTDLLDRIRRLSHPHKVIYFASDLEDTKQIMAAGADHVILRNAPPDGLLPLIRKNDLQSNHA